MRAKKSKLREYAEALITALLLAFVLRSFVIEAFKVPSASMVPSILIGDHLFVNKFAYGLRIPLTKNWLVRLARPEHGEIAVFIYPIDDSKDFIKRVIGLPGDQVVLEDRQLTINQVPVPRVDTRVTLDGKQLLIEPTSPEVPSFEVDVFPQWQDYDFFIETLGTRSYVVQYHRDAPQIRASLVVPPDHFMVIGDNRNNSSDSRDWGFVPFDNLKGRSLFVWLSLDYDAFEDGLTQIANWVRWDRFGHWL